MVRSLFVGLSGIICDINVVDGLLDLLWSAILPTVFQVSFISMMAMENGDTHSASDKLNMDVVATFVYLCSTLDCSGKDATCLCVRWT